MADSHEAVPKVCRRPVVTKRAAHESEGQFLKKRRISVAEAVLKGQSQPKRALEMANDLWTEGHSRELHVQEARHHQRRAGLRSLCFRSLNCGDNGIGNKFRA